MSKGINYLLREEREKRGWSQARVAEQIDTSAINISRWERGYATPSPFFREKLCQLYGKSALDLGFLGNEPEEVNKPDSPSPKPILALPTEKESRPEIEVPSQGSRRLACLGYLFLWVSGIYVFFFTGKDRFVRFHSLQSTLFFGASNLVSTLILALLVVTMKVASSGDKVMLTIVFLCLLVLLLLINLFTLIGWVVGLFQAWHGNYYSFPFLRRSGVGVFLAHKLMT
jgi:uncharacterized membrane protein/DNA-binding XRE family transcriptional regulator